jgi:hypothetical protein
MNGFDLFKAVNNADMKYIEQAESYSRVKTRRPAKVFRLSVGIAAAAALMTVTAGATILTRFANRDSVEKYLLEDSVNILEEQGLALNYTAENEHIRLTVDAMLSDGNLGKMIMTLEGLDEKGLERIKNFDPLPELYLTDGVTGEYIANSNMGGAANITGGGHVNFDAQTDNTITCVATLDTWSIEVGKPYTLRFGLRDCTLPEEQQRERGEYDVLTNNLMEGISFDTYFTPNVESKMLKNEDGVTVYLSEIGLFTEDDKLAQFYTSKDRHETKLTPKDSVFGKKVEFDFLNINRDPSFDKPKTRMWFRDVIDVNEYDGIEINGVKYTEE